MSSVDPKPQYLGRDVYRAVSELKKFGICADVLIEKSVGFEHIDWDLVHDIRSQPKEEWQQMNENPMHGAIPYEDWTGGHICADSDRLGWLAPFHRSYNTNKHVKGHVVDFFNNLVHDLDHCLSGDRAVVQLALYLTKSLGMCTPNVNVDTQKQAGICA